MKKHQQVELVALEGDQLDNPVITYYVCLGGARAKFVKVRLGANFAHRCQLWLGAKLSRRRETFP
jgi:hypothetical protein